MSYPPFTGNSSGGFICNLCGSLGVKTKYNFSTVQIPGYGGT